MATLQPRPPGLPRPKAAASEEDEHSSYLSPPGQPYDSMELQRNFTGMSARGVYVLLCKRSGCRAVSHVTNLLPEKAQVWDLVDLDFSRTYVGHRGVVPIMELIKLFPQLRTLNLSCNFLTNQSVWHICKVAMYHPSLIKLELNSNDISWTAGMCLLELVAKNQNIERVGLNETLLKPKVVDAINMQIRRNTMAGSRQNRKGPSSSNHPITIRQRALKRFFRDSLLREDRVKDGTLPRKYLIEGLKENMKLMGKEADIQNRSLSSWDKFLKRTESDNIDWEHFMLLVMVDDVIYDLKLVEDLRKVFRHFDLDEAGYVEFRDLKDIMSMVLGGSAEPRDEEVLATMEVYDADETMTVSWDEFLLLLYDRGPVVGSLGSFATSTPLKKQRSLHV